MDGGFSGSLDPLLGCVVDDPVPRLQSINYIVITGSRRCGHKIIHWYKSMHNNEGDRYTVRAAKRSVKHPIVVVVVRATR